MKRKVYESAYRPCGVRRTSGKGTACRVKASGVGAAANREAMLFVESAVDQSAAARSGSAGGGTAQAGMGRLAGGPPA